MASNAISGVSNNPAFIQEAMRTNAAGQANKTDGNRPAPQAEATPVNAAQTPLDRRGDGESQLGTLLDVQA